MTVRLASNRPAERFYRGGERITDFRGEPAAAAREPEDWVASTTTVFGEERLGLSALPDGRLLRDAVSDDPQHWLGAAHVERWGADTRLLVKLLDAGQRLPVHAHPHDDFAASHLGHAHGKAEAWYILTGGTVHVGLRHEVAADELARLVATQDTEALLALLHAVTVVPGDVVWVPPGELHAIGAGILLLELQQPEDLSILLEWRDFAIDGDRFGHLGLGFDRALSAVNRAACPPERLRRLVRTPGPGEALLPVEAEEYFRLERREVAGEETLDEGFAVLVVASGALEIDGAAAPAGSTWLAAAADGPVEVRGHGAMLVTRPPAP